MKNINQKLVFVAMFALVLGVAFGPMANTALAAAPIVTASAATNITQTSADLNGTVNPNGATTSAWFLFNSTSYGTQNGLTGSSVIPMTYNLTGLTPNTNYSFTVQAINGSGMVTSSVVNFTTASTPVASAPTISGVGASSITSNSATLDGSVNPNGSPTSAWFTMNSTNYGTQNGMTGASPIAMSYNMTGLTPNTTYSFRIEAINSGGMTIGSTVNFTTSAAPAGSAPTVLTLAATNITSTGAQLNGSVNPNGSSTSAYFTCASSNYGTQNGLTGVAPIVMSYNLTGLTPNTNYSCRVEAINSNGMTVGNTINFTTLPAVVPGAPVITSVAASNITSTSADLNGTWDAQGFSTTTHFEYGTTIGLGSSTANVVQGLGTGNMTANIAGLSNNTTYFFRAVGVNANGTTNGATLSFTTAPGSGGGGGGGGGSNSSPNVRVFAATNIGDGKATLNGWSSKWGATKTWFQWTANPNVWENETAHVSIADDSDISEIITGLVPNVTYYFRVGAENNHRRVFSGALSFRLEGNSLKPVTYLSSSVGQTTARINGLVLNADAGAETWFEYGRTTDLGYSTPVKSVSGNSTEVSNVLGNLAPDILYFFRLVAKNSVGTVNGEIKIFKTLSTTVAPIEIDEETDEALVSVSIEAAPATVAPNEEVNFTVTYKNTSDKDLNDVVVRVVMPEGIEFSNSSIGNYENSDRTLSANVGSLDAGEEGIITLSGIVSSDARDQEVLVTTASVVYTNGDNQGDALDYALVDVVVDPNLLPAASIFGAGFFPSTLLGWMVLLLVVLGLVMLGRKFYTEVNWANLAVETKNIFKKGQPPTNLPM